MSQFSFTHLLQWNVTWEKKMAHETWRWFYFLHPLFSVQICGDYLLSKMGSQNAISFRNFASSMGDGRVLAKVDAYIQDHLLEVSEQEDFLKLPRLKVNPDEF